MKFEVNCCIVDKNRISRKIPETLREKKKGKFCMSANIDFNQIKSRVNY